MFFYQALSALATLGAPSVDHGMHMDPTSIHRHPFTSKINTRPYSTSRPFVPRQFYQISKMVCMIYVGPVDISGHWFGGERIRCPDGSSALCQQENSSFIFLKLHTTETPEFLQPLVQPSPILDYAWYPFATPLDPASHCFLASVRECPIRLVDASDGRVCAFLPDLVVNLIGRVAQSVLQDCRSSRTTSRST